MDEAERLCERVAIMDHGKIIALGSPRELVASIGVEHVVEFSVDAAGQPLDPKELSAIEGVRDVRADNGVNGRLPAMTTFQLTKVSWQPR
jgi:ABC-2 type transport system ATP-binding protein